VAQSGRVSAVPSRRPIRVIVASGSRPLRELLSRSLAHDERFSVIPEASDGDAVVGCLDSYDLALVDLTLPGLGILGVLSRLRCHPAHPVVVMAHTDAVYLRNAVAAEGGADYVVIPDDLEELADRLIRAAPSTLPAVS
jgi:DNA-binding response OmpR family regulator